MTVNSDTGQFDPETKAVILASMMADAKDRFGEDLNENELAVIRLFYDPVAERQAQSQRDMADVLSSTQLRYAEGGALDLFCEQLGLTRQPARVATGVATFSRETAASTDYTIPRGTNIQTDSNDPYSFTTTEAKTLLAGNVSVDAPIAAVEGGVDSNVGPNSISTFSSSVTGIESVTNPTSTTGGKERELDEEFRERTKKELGAGSRASQPALVRAVRRVPDVESVSIFANDQSASGTVDGLNPHEVELVVEGGDTYEVADMLLETKAAGDVLVGGVHGTEISENVVLDNGQSKAIKFSNPEQIKLYIDVDVSTSDRYDGDDAVRDSIVSYVGGVFTTGNKEGGRISVSDDVIYGEIEYAIRDVPGVFDVNSLTVGVSANPTGTANITIQDYQLATADAVDGSISITENPI